MKISVFTSCLAASLTFFTSVNSQQVTRNGVNFELNGAPFNFAGTNIYDGTKNSVSSFLLKTKPSTQLLSKIPNTPPM